jgi:hypothetical protein
MMSRKLLYVAGLVVIISGFTLNADAQRRFNNRERWDYLGQSNVDGVRDHDSIRVNTRGAYRAIQLRVQNPTSIGSSACHVSRS